MSPPYLHRFGPNIFRDFNTSVSKPSGASLPAIPGINHPCLVRKTDCTYHLLDPAFPSGGTAIDVGQIKEFVFFDWQHLSSGSNILEIVVVPANES